MITQVKETTLRAILKYKDHPSILPIQNNCKNRIKLAFEEMDLLSVEKENKLKINKARQSLHIPTKIFKKYVDTFAVFLWKSVNSSIKSPTFPSCLKSTDEAPLHKIGKIDKKDNYRSDLNVLKTACLQVRCLLISMKYF